MDKVVDSVVCEITKLDPDFIIGFMKVEEVFKTMQ